MKIAVNGIHVHVREQGGGSLPLVFLHYWGGSSRTWRHVIDALPGTHKTIAIDHRGWGLSDAPTSGYGLTELAADAEAVIEALGLADYVLVGHSMGGKVAQLMASRKPQGLRGLVLVAPSPPTAMELPLEARQMMAVAYDSAEAIGMTIDHVLTHKPLSPEDRAQIVEDSLRGAPQAKLAWPMSTMLEDISGQVAAINVPTLVVAGECDKVDSVDALKAKLLPRIPQATLHVLPGTGHLSPLESPIELAQLIASFATKVG